MFVCVQSDHLVMNCCFYVTVAKAYSDLNLFQKKHDVNPLRGFLVPLVQVSLCILLYFCQSVQNSSSIFYFHVYACMVCIVLFVGQTKTNLAMDVFQGS